MKISTRTLIVLMLILIGGFLTVNGYVMYKKNFSNNIIIKENISTINAEYIFNSYIVSVPDISDRMYFGYPNSSVTIIGYLDFQSSSSDYFFEDIFPSLKNEYIDSGQIRFYNKNYLTFDDINQKSENFLLAAALECAKSSNKDVYFKFYFKLFNTTFDQLDANLDELNISREKIRKCMQNNSFEKLKKDSFEVENFNMIGISPRFYIGLYGRDNAIVELDYQRFKNAIKQHQILLGE